MKDAFGFELTPGDIVSFTSVGKELRMGRVERFTAQKIVIAKDSIIARHSVQGGTYLSVHSRVVLVDPEYVTYLAMTPYVQELVDKFKF